MTADTGLPGRLIFAVSVAAPLVAAAGVCGWVAPSLSAGFFATAVAVFILGLSREAGAPFRRYFTAATAPVCRRLLNAAAAVIYWVALAPLGVLPRSSRGRGMWYRARRSQTSYWKAAER